MKTPNIDNLIKSSYLSFDCNTAIFSLVELHRLKFKLAKAVEILELIYKDDDTWRSNYDLKHFLNMIHKENRC